MRDKHKFCVPYHEHADQIARERREARASAYDSCIHAMEHLPPKEALEFMRAFGRDGEYYKSEIALEKRMEGKSLSELFDLADEMFGHRRSK